MPNTLLDVDLKNARVPQIHNRWHPDIPAIASVNIGDTWRCESVDWTGGQIGDDESANDVRDVQLTQVHYLTGPVHVNGVKPGDLLVVDIADIGMLPDSEWGFTGIFDFANGGGFLCDHYRDAGKMLLEFRRGLCLVTPHKQCQVCWIDPPWFDWMCSFHETSGRVEPSRSQIDCH